MVRSREALEEEYRRLTPRSREQWERGKPVMPGGVIKGAYWMSPYPTYMERAQDCYLWDLDGRKYVDFANHHTTTILGHSHPTVVEAVQRELDKGIAFGAPTALEAEVAEEITGRFPSIDKVRYTNSGTEASLHTTRLARTVTGKPKVAKFEGAYHGSHDALEISVGPPLDKAGPSDSPGAVASWDGMARGSEEDVVVLPYNQPESVALILREKRDEISAVFYDGKPGVLDVPDDFTRFVRELTGELGLLMVMDEVVSFRAGYGGYQGLAGVKPDITLFGKIVGGGFPAGALGGRADLMDVLDNSQPPVRLNQSGSFSGHNFTLAAALATLTALTPEVYEHLDRLGARLHEGLVDVFGSAGIPCQVLSAGSLVNPYLTDRPVRDYRALTSVDNALFERISLGLLLEGYHLGRPGMTMALSSPMTDEQIDGLLGALDAVLQAQG